MLKSKNKFIVVFLSVLMLFVGMSSTILKPNALTNQNISTSSKYILKMELNEPYALYLNGNVKLMPKYPATDSIITKSWWSEHQDVFLTVEPPEGCTYRVFVANNINDGSSVQYMDFPDYSGTRTFSYKDFENSPDNGTLYFWNARQGVTYTLTLKEGVEESAFVKVINSATELGKTLFDIAGQTVELMTSNPIMLIGLITFLIGIGLFIFKHIVKGV